jgi:ribonuclease PH
LYTLCAGVCACVKVRPSAPLSRQPASTSLRQRYAGTPVATSVRNARYKYRSHRGRYTQYIRALDVLP